MNFLNATIRSIVVIAALTLWVSFAADIDGKWTAQTEGRNGPRTETLILKSSGNSLTGTMQGGRGGPAEISNGTIDGDNVSFSVVREFGENKISQQYKGTISGGDLKLTVSGGRAGRGPVELSFKKDQP